MFFDIQVGFFFGPKGEAMKNFVNTMQYRQFRIDSRKIDEKNRTVELSFSSDEPYERWFGFEVLGHNAGEVRMDRITSGMAPLLKDHNRSIQTGVIESARLVGGKGRAVVRFSKRQYGEDEFQDVVDGIRGNVSVGYMVHAMELVSEKDGVSTYRVTDWEPLEISIVSIPADTSVGVGRSNSEGAKQMTIENFDSENGNGDQHKRPRAIRREAEQSERYRVSEIQAIAARFGLETEGRRAVSEGWPLEQFRALTMDHLEKRNAQPPQQRFDTGIGMTRREVDRFSLLRLVRVQAFPNEPKYRKEAAFELEVAEAAGQDAQRAGLKTSGLRVPIDVTNSWKRTLTAGTATDGAELVADNLLAGSFIDVLRNQTVVISMGARTMNGLFGNVLIPRKTSGAAWTWITAESGDAANSEAQFDQVSMTPKTGGAYTDISRQLLLQGTPDAENLIRDDLARAAALGIDLACLYGSGANGQPKGVKNQTGINTPTNFAAAVPTWAEVVAMESAVAVDNALLGNLGYIIEPAMRGSLKITPRETGYPVYIIDDDDGGNTLNGYKLGTTSQVTAGDIFFGNWNDLIVGFWGGLDILVDPYTLGLSGAVRLIVHQSCDVCVRHPVSFAFNNDGV